jgi:hypothetical protein
LWVGDGFGLRDGHRAEDDQDAERLQWRERLAERDPADRGRDDGTEQRQERHAGRRERTDAAEPERVRDGGSDGREVGVAGEVGPRQRRRWRPFDGERDRRRHQAARDKLPSRRRQQRRRGRPAFGEHDARGHHGSSAERSRGAGGVQRRVAAEHEQPHAHDADRTGNDDARRGALTEDSPGQRHDQQRLDRDDGRGDAARQPIRGNEQQREERADVQRSEHDGPPPPGALRQPSGQRHEHEPGRERAGHGGQQRTPRREPLARDEVRRAPDRGSQPGHCESLTIA